MSPSINEDKVTRWAIGITTGGTWGTLAATVMLAYLHTAVWFATVASGVIGLAWVFAFDSLFPSRDKKEQR